MPTDGHAEHYLSIEELCARTTYARKSVYNMISKRILKEGEHYFKPTPRKLLFFWPAIDAWIRRGANGRKTEGTDDTDE